jgi:hypothetical protein
MADAQGFVEPPAVVTRDPDGLFSGQQGAALPPRSEARGFGAGNATRKILASAKWLPPL